MESKVKHDGCYKCGSKEDKILTSVATKECPTFGFALCNKCVKLEMERNNVR